MSALFATREGILNILYITFLIVFAISLIILLIFTRTVFLPLKKITAGANEYAHGNLTYHIDVENRDEMGYLAATLNYMSCLLYTSSTSSLSIFSEAGSLLSKIWQST